MRQTQRESCSNVKRRVGRFDIKCNETGGVAYDRSGLRDLLTQCVNQRCAVVTIDGAFLRQRQNIQHQL